MLFWPASVTPLLLAAHAAFIPVTGTVRDADSGMPLAAVIVSLENLRQTILTDEHGRYSFEAPPGTEHVTVQRFGYAPQTFDAIIPESGALEINVALRREPIMLPPIEVRAPVAIRGLDQPARSVAFPDRSVSQAAMYQHPLSPEPDAFRALGGGEVALDPEAPSGLHIRGGATDQVGYLLDGIPVFSPYHSGGTFSAWNADALSSVDLLAASPLHAAPDALSGVVSANTRAPGRRFQTRGSVSAMQARATIDGPVGRTGVGYLVSVSSAFPGLAIHKDEPSHLRGDNLDWLGKMESPLLGGRMRLTGYQSRNEIDVAAVAEPSDTAAADFTRSTLGWNSRSLGGEWSRPLGERAGLLLRAWTATGDASTAWIGPDSLEHLASSRRDDGAVAMIDLAALGGTTTVGGRLQEVESAYSLRPTDDAEQALSFQGVTPMSTFFVEHERPLSATVEVGASFANTFAMGEVYYSPSGRVSWRASPTLLLTGTAARRQQFGQSLRNPESVVSNVFPVDLYVDAGSSGIPVATSDIGILALEHRPKAWLRLGGQAYLRDFESLALVAPNTAEPYATDGFVVGSGASHGVSLEAGVSREHYGFLASYAYQSVEFRYPAGDYAPGYGSTHTFQAGLVLSPSSSYSVRLGFEGIVGRRTTAALGSVEWEACNILDGGCEFAGSQSRWTEALGATGLPAYYRLDLGVRKQWDVSLGGRDGHLAVFGTATNLLARMNVLTVAVDPATGQRSNVDMMPPSPLVVGIDWRF
ncbi:MAG TPA: TonB-dependent receptor [Candidatus Krumholzibacteria bacterium]|nr:TonB-dependent receptor [Candidatus Krumholzibacteria bacterium]